MPSRLRRHVPWLMLAGLFTGCATAPPAPPPSVQNRIYIANESGNSVSVIDANTLEALKTIPLALKGAHDMALTRDGRTLFVSNLLSASRRFREHVVFVPDYDMGVARLLTRGTDVWLNNPVRPLEACGTSGMKAGLNGSLNCSILDGWWPEACRHGVNGWAIGDGATVPNQDDHDFDALYGVLENDVLPAWADRARWIGMMQASIADVAKGFSASRMIREYFARLYATD